ncbi:teneurin-m isoform X2 [Dermacentor albipictus]|uniref:teneurin-m isoform X2 n=1 Tax=Dermacentor albipictus TaxID=60249 RepID=UPI0031FBF054
MGRTGGGGGRPPAATAPQSMLAQDQDPAEYEPTSCLARTPSGSLFIPSDLTKGPSSPQGKTDFRTSNIIQDETKTNPDRLGYGGAATGGAAVGGGIPLRNHVRHPLGPGHHFPHSRMHLRKTLSSRCSWKCAAITAFVLSLALVIALVYFIAVPFLSWQGGQHRCPVVIDDAEASAGGESYKSTYHRGPNADFDPNRARQRRRRAALEHPASPPPAPTDMPTNIVEGSGEEPQHFWSPHESESSAQQRNRGSRSPAYESEFHADTVIVIPDNPPATRVSRMRCVCKRSFGEHSEPPHSTPLSWQDDSQASRSPPVKRSGAVEASTELPPPLPRPMALFGSPDHNATSNEIPMSLPDSNVDDGGPEPDDSSMDELTGLEKNVVEHERDGFPAPEQDADSGGRGGVSLPPLPPPPPPPLPSSVSSESGEEASNEQGLSGADASEFLTVGKSGPDGPTPMPFGRTDGYVDTTTNLNSIEHDASTETDVDPRLFADKEAGGSGHSKAVPTTAAWSTEWPPDLGPSVLPPKTLPPSSGESFADMSVGRRHSKVVASYGHWNVQFHQQEPGLVKFNYTLPTGASVGIYGRRNSVPTHTRYDFAEILSARDRRHRKAAKESFSMEFIHFLDHGRWYISVYNDGDQQQEISFVSVATDVSSLPCPYDCHGHGTCNMGKCDCDQDYAGESCAYRVCPVLCSGRGQYTNGECVCQPGWKGRECQLREDECEVADCSGHGDCLDGVCRCFPGYKGAHCEEVDCLDPECSGHGVCVSGMCLCRKGWKSNDCSEPDSDALRCLPDCSGHGQFDLDLQRCACDDQWTGPDCSQEKCDLDCGPHGRCQGGECICIDGWTGLKCNEKLCDIRCVEHGQCKNGTCLCIQGWNGRHCTLEGCPHSCNSHGDCIMSDGDWRCKCHSGWDGPDCNVPMEKTCDDRIDNDNDGLTDCADSECCSHKACTKNPLCFASSDPLDILLRKQPPAVTASFFQRMQFLIEEDSVQSYAKKDAFNDSRASVVRGQVVSSSGSPLKGIRVGTAGDGLIGFTVTRDSGWFDLMVNGGGAVTLQFRRDPFDLHERTVMVPWNEIVVMNKVIMSLSQNKALENRGLACTDHDYDTMRPVVLATWKHGFQGGCPERSAVLAESQVVQESIAIPGTALHLVYHSSRAGGYLSTIQLQLTPETIPLTLRLIHLKISIEGILFEKKFEADPGIKFTYAWNRRNVYRQKVYGVAVATVYVGYEYSNCPSVIWEVQATQVSGHDMSISEIGGWNLDIHHRYNFHEGILQKGDGTNIYLKNKPKVMLTAVGDGQQRPLHCPQCNGIAKEQRLLAPVALASSPDGSIYVGDFNLIRQITTDGKIRTIVELSAAQVAYRYHLAVGPADGRLYLSDPERYQILQIVTYKDIPDVKNNVMVVVGNGAKCLPGDKMLCGDGRPARDAKLAYPKGIAISMHNEIFIADGTNIRMVDKHGIIHTLIGDHYHKNHWKPIPCTGTFSLTQVNLRWPTELSINPLDNSLHILDDHMVLRVTPDKRIKIVAGRPLHCPSTAGRERSDFATDVFLEAPQSLAFGPNGDLYIAESDSQLVNRVRVLGSDGRISRFAGAELKCSCLELNCKCFDEDHFLASTSKLSTISSITVTPDGILHVCDQGNLRVRSVTASLPKPNDQHLYEIYSPETQQVYTFNRHGQHTSTRNILTGKVIYTFTYNVNTSFGKLNTVTDAEGNKIYILRDYSNHVKTIENTQGAKCQVEMSRMKLLQSFVTPDNFKTVFDYHGSTGLVRSKIDSSGRSVVYAYDEYGRLTEAITPSGQTIRLSYNLSTKGASVTVTRDSKDPVSLLIKGSDVTTRIGLSEERITQTSDGSLLLLSEDASSRDIETVANPVITDLSPVLGETFPVPAKLRISLSDDVIQRFEWRYYLRREGKARQKQIMQVGRKLKVNGDNLLAIEFDRQQYSETLYDRNQLALLTVRYDSLGHPLSWQPTQNVTSVTLEYDRFGRLIRWERGQLSEKYSFDIRGRLADVRYADGSGIMYKYDDGPISVPTEIILPSGSRYILQYDVSGSLQAVITPNGHKHEIATQTSIGFYKLLYLAPGVGHPYVLHYNDRGQVLAKFFPKNKGRVVYTYTEEGRLESILCGPERTDFYYHNSTALIKSITKNVPGLDFRVDYRHHGSLLKEERHRYNSRSGLDGAKFRYQYDPRLSSVEVEINGKSTITTKYRYNSESGTLEQVQQFLVHRPKLNSIFIQDEARQYSKTIGTDTYGRLVVLAITLWNKEIFSLSLQYDNRSRIKHAHTKIGKDHASHTTNYTYTVDGFLEEVSGAQSWRFIYDINGNMKSLWEGPRQISLRHDDGDRLIGYGDVELYLVDVRGFIVQRGEEKFKFNAMGQLIHAFELHQYEVQYVYDAQNRLTARKDHRGNITQFIYADLQRPNAITHMHYPKDSLTFVLIYDTLGHLIYMQQGNNKFYVACDHLGSPVAVFSSEGTIIKEIQRNPFGKVTYDSNPEFFLPVDFQGGLRDPVTQLIHFGGRVYDALGVQWLTPNWESMPTLLQKPYDIHLYRFHGNDPINTAQADGGHLNDLPAWMAALGYDMRRVLVAPQTRCPPDTRVGAPVPEAVPVISGLSCMADIVQAEFYRFSTVPKTAVKLDSSSFQRHINSRVSNLPSVLGDGILLSRGDAHRAAVHVVSESSPILRDVMVAIFNDTLVVDIHFSLHGQDSFFFVQPQLSKADEDWVQLGRLGTMFNITKHVVESEGVGGPRGQVDIRMHSTSVVLNIRYGTSLQEERHRLMRHARRRAVDDAWTQELELVRNGHKGSNDWTKGEREELMATGMVARYFGTDVHDIEKYPELADDPSNVAFRKENSRKRRGKTRRARLKADA